MQRLFRISLPVMAILLIVVIVVSCAAPTPAAQPVTTQAAKSAKWKEIVIPVIHDVTGPYSATVLPSLNAAKDFTKWFNDKGGIDGVPIRVEWHDMRGDKAALVSAYQKVRETKPLCVIIGTFTDLVAERLAEDKIPGLTTTVSTQIVWPPAWVLAIAGTYFDTSGLALDYIAEDWAKSGKSGKCRVAFFVPDIYVGKDMTSPEVMEYAKTKSNIEIVATEYFDYAAMDLSSDILRVMQSEPDWLLGFYYTKSGSAFYRSLDANGLLGKVKVCNVVWGMQSENAKLVEPRIIEGVVGPMHIPPVMPKGEKQVNAGVQWTMDLFDKNNNPEDYRGQSYLSGMQFWFLTTEIINRAVKNVGWEKLDGTAIFETFKDARDVDLGGISHWGSAPGCRYNDKNQMFRFTNGQPLPISDRIYTAPDLRPAKYRSAEYDWSSTGWPK